MKRGARVGVPVQRSGIALPDNKCERWTHSLN